MDSEPRTWVHGPSDDEWAILELFGHRQLAGKITEVDRFGVKMCRIDIPSEPPVTQFYGGAAIYGITITTEEIATKVARRTPPATHALGLPAHAPAPAWHADLDDDRGGVRVDDIDTGDPRECDDCGAEFDPTQMSPPDRDHPELCDDCNAAFNRTFDEPAVASFTAAEAPVTQEEFDALLQREVLRDPETGALAFVVATGAGGVHEAPVDDALGLASRAFVAGLTASTEVIVAAAESLRCPHDCTHTMAEGCPHNCSCRNCDIPF